MPNALRTLKAAKHGGRLIEAEPARAVNIVCDQPRRLCEWVARKNGSTWNADFVNAIGLERNGQLIAGTVYDNFLGGSICMHTAIERMNRDFLWYCFYYPFVELNVRKVLGLVDSFNSRAIHFDRHLGFELEATIQGASMKGDLLIFSMTRAQCRWLGVRQHGQQRR